MCDPQNLELENIEDVFVANGYKRIEIKKWSVKKTAVSQPNEKNTGRSKEEVW